LPFQSASLPQLLFAIDEQTPPPLGALRPDVDPALAFAIDRAMAKRPELRFQSAEEMLAALPRAPGTPLAAPPITYGPPPSPFRMAPTAAAPMPKRARSSTPIWIVALVATGIVVGAILLVARGVERHLRPPDASTSAASASATSEAGAAVPSG